MKITADKNIPFVEEAFSCIGEVHLLPGREITPESVSGADALLVRTVTRVDEQLLEGSKVKFVGTATIGYDHIDVEYLGKKAIGFSYAPGSNANSVSEYITSAVFAAFRDGVIRFGGITAGIIGCGNVGSLVDAKFRAAGIKTILNDPPLFDETGDDRYRPLDEILERSDIITVHTPLSTGGKYPTSRMCDEAFFSRMKHKPLFMNSSRGGVVDSSALKNALEGGRAGGAVLDVWENEPDIDFELLEKCAIGTPHIAGYSLDGKANATKMLFDAACSHFNFYKKWIPENMPAPAEPVIETASADFEKTVGEAVLRAYNIRRDDACLRKLTELKDKSERGARFDALRNGYPVRREFPNFTVKLRAAAAKTAETLRKLGFKLKAC